MGFGIATQTGISAAIQSIPSFMSNKGLRNGYGATFAENFTDGTNTLDPRITFSRASNATVTDSSGNIVYAPHNLLTFSEQFDNAAWTKSGVSVTANNTTAPDGTTTADKIITANGSAFSASSLFQAPSKATSPLKITISVYAKAGEFNGMRLFTAGANTSTARCFADFNLATGEVISVVQGTSGFDDCTAAVTSSGSGWYRCSITFTSDSAATVRAAYYPRNTTGSTGDGTSGIYLWGAQLEISSTATTYNPTTVKNLLGFSEQFDNAAWTKSNSFIQTNLITFSEQFDNAAWSKTATTITANAALAPNSTTTADKLIATVDNSTHFITQASSFTSGITYTASIFAKKGEWNFVRIGFASDRFASTGRSACFNLNTGAVGDTQAGVTASIQDIGNGWYRCSISAVAASTGASSGLSFNPQSVDSATSESIAGDGTSGIFIWGAQLVQGSVAGDYQQTTSSALAVMYQDPNGTMTADKLVEDTATAFHQFTQSYSAVAGSILAISLYAKAGERPRLRIAGLNSANWATLPQAVFDLVSGTVVTSNGTQTATITDVGNGWYRCTIFGQSTLSGTATVGMGAGPVRSGSTTNSYTGDGTSGIYIWGAQLSDSASLDTYVNNPVAAPSSTAYYGPRFDYDPVTLQPRGLLIEEQRTNLVLRSEEFENANWVPTGVSVTANSSTSPSGATTADTLAADGATSSHFLGATDGAGAKAVSVYAKAGTGTFFQIAVGGTAEPYANFNLSTGTSSAFGTGTTASITAVGNGWYRCVMVTTNAAATAVRFAIVSSISSARLESFASSATVLLWGAQSELGAFPTSYIPTTTAQVTRSADIALIQGSNFSSWYNQNEGTLAGAGALLTASYTGGVFLDIGAAGAFGTTEYINYNGTAWVLSPSSAPISVISLVTTSSSAKVAAGLKLNDSVMAANGIIGTVDTSCTIPVNATILNIGKGGWSGGTNYFNGHIRQIAYYPTRLQNSQLQAITS